MPKFIVSTGRGLEVDVGGAASEMDAVLSDLRTRLATFRVGAGPLGIKIGGVLPSAFVLMSLDDEVALVETLKVRTETGTSVSLSKMGTLMAKDGQTAVLSLFDPKVSGQAVVASAS